LRAKQIDGTERDLVLTGVSYVPWLWHNLFSISAALKQGCKLSSEGYLVSLRKGDFKISFDQIVRTKKGFLMGIKLEPRFKVAAMSLMEGKSVSIVILHRCLGHPSEATTRDKAKAMGTQVKGALEKSEERALGKARQKNMPKISTSRLSRKAERLLIKISSMNNRSVGGSKYWLLIEDEAPRA
jgi:hypothetical protein